MAQYSSVSAVYGQCLCQSISCHRYRTTRMGGITDCTHSKHCHGSSDPSAVMKTWSYLVWLLYYCFNKSVLSTEEIRDTFWKKKNITLMVALLPDKNPDFLPHYILKNCFFRNNAQRAQTLFHLPVPSVPPRWPAGVNAELKKQKREMGKTHFVLDQKKQSRRRRNTLGSLISPFSLYKVWEGGKKKKNNPETLRCLCWYCLRGKNSASKVGTGLWTGSYSKGLRDSNKLILQSDAFISPLVNIC